MFEQKNESVMFEINVQVEIEIEIEIEIERRFVFGSMKVMDFLVKKVVCYLLL